MSHLKSSQVHSQAGHCGEDDEPDNRSDETIVDWIVPNPQIYTYK